MPEENKIKKDDAQVDLDTSGPEFDVTLPEEKKEDVIEKEETVKEVIKDQEPEEVKEVKEEPKEEPKQETKEEDTKLEDYSKGVQSRIAKLTRKMREAERQRDSATEYAQALETQRKVIRRNF